MSGVRTWSTTWAVATGASRWRRRGCRAIGYDIDPECVRLARESAARFAPAGLVTIERRDVHARDLREADVVMPYLSPEPHERLLPQLARLKPGSRVASHAFQIPGVIPDRVVAVPSVEDDLVHTLFALAPRIRPLGSQNSHDSQNGPAQADAR
jgi:hypothetical protein